MKFLIGIPLALIAIIYGSPFVALALGVAFALIHKNSDEIIDKSIGTSLLQAGIVILGLTMASSEAIYLTSKYFPYISGFVIITFLVGIFIARVLKIDQKLAILIASGTAICGATAMAAIAPLIKAKPKDLLISLAIIFLFNAVAIVALPLIGSGLGMSEEQFGSWAAMAIHDTGSVIGAAMSFGGNTVETAATLKLGRTLWLIPLILILGVFFKDNEATNIKAPLFVFMFILAILLGSQLNLSEHVLSFLESTSRTFLVGALFCIGSQIKLEAIKAIDFRTILLALFLWIFALVTSLYLINLLQ